MIVKKNIKLIEKKINYVFKNKIHLINSLTHPSFYKERNKNINDNVNEFERLEFLGDRVLGLSIASLIFKKYKKFNEGKLTKKLSYLVQKNFLYKIALELGIENFLAFSKKNQNNKMTISILSDSVESLIGAIYIDGGYSQAYKFIKSIWEPYLDLEESNEQDPKTKLQEISQKKFKTLPEYKLIKKYGPSHSPNFTISLEALNMKLIKASGSSKREAEKNAALKILKLYSEK